jgi:peroxiredoxin
LGQLQGIASELLGMGYQMIAISPDLPENQQVSIKKHSLSFQLVSDSTMSGAKAFGLAYKVDKATMKELQGFGIDLAKASGEKHGLLPVPAAYIVGVDGVINFQYVNPDYTVRVDPELLLAAARIAKRPTP